MGRSIYDGFQKRQPQRSAEIQEALRHGLVVFDANILLNFYKMHQEAFRDWIQLLKGLEGRVWIPHQVIEEFWKHRDSVAAHPGESTQALSGINGGLKDVVKAYRTWMFHRSTGGEEVRALEERLEGAVVDIRSSIQQAINEHQSRFSVDPTKDDVVQQLEPLLQDKIGDPYGHDELVREQKKAESRYENREPPGFEDKKKDGDSKYGDYLMWRQTLDHIKESWNPVHRALIIVTNDVKQDWWQWLRTPEGEDPVPIPHVGLVEEFEAQTQDVPSAPLRYLQLTADQFLTEGESALNVKVSDSTVATTRSIRTDADWLPQEFRIGLNHVGGSRKNDAATAQIAVDGKRTVVAAGSLAKKELADSISGSFRRHQRKLVEEDLLVDSDYEGFYEFAGDVTFSSSSTAASLVAGGNQNGRIRWKTADSETLEQVLSDTGQHADAGEDEL